MAKKGGYVGRVVLSLGKGSVILKAAEAKTTTTTAGVESFDGNFEIIRKIVRAF